MAPGFRRFIRLHWRKIRAHQQKMSLFLIGRHFCCCHGCSGLDADKSASKRMLKMTIIKNVLQANKIKFSLRKRKGEKASFAMKDLRRMSWIMWDFVYITHDIFH